LERFKLFVATLPVIAAITAFYYYAEESLLYRVIGILVAFGLSAAIAYQSEVGRAAFAFVRDSRNEVRKVVWPTFKETTQTTMFVMVAVVIMGICLWILDFILSWAVGFLTK
jgi:preprotein translocase subunit SecE